MSTSGAARLGREPFRDERDQVGHGSVRGGRHGQHLRGIRRPLRDDDEGRRALSLDVKLHAAEPGPRDVDSDVGAVRDEQTLVRDRDRPFDEWRMAAKLLAGREDSGDGIEGVTVS